MGVSVYDGYWYNEWAVIGLPLSIKLTPLQKQAYWINGYYYKPSIGYSKTENTFEQIYSPIGFWAE